MSEVRNEELNHVYTPEFAYVFDVDGVLTNPEHKRVTQQEIYTEIIKRLKAYQPVCFNTGRSLNFIDREILIPIESMLTGKHLLKNVFAIGEKGSIWISYNKLGKKSVSVDPSVCVPIEIQAKVRSILNKPEFYSLVFYDETKNTMVTAELRHGVRVKEFMKVRQELVSQLQTILDTNDRGGEFKVTGTRIAVDLESKIVGKGYGTQKFVQFLNDRHIKPISFVCFGDSPEDLEIHKKLKVVGNMSKFVYVGHATDLEKERDSDIIFANEAYDNGTLTYLQSQNIYR